MTLYDTLRRYLDARDGSLHHRIERSHERGTFNLRAWLRPPPASRIARTVACLSGELNLSRRVGSIAAGVTVCPGEGEVTLRLGVPFVSAFLSVEGPVVHRAIRWLCPDHKTRSVEGYVNFDSECVDGPHIHWRLWSPTGEWSCTTPAWRDGGVFLWSLIFGASDCTTEVLSEHDARVPLPEGEYPVRVRIERRTWTRPRWPRALGPWLVSTSADLEAPQGLPVPGKWSDDDAIYAMGGGPGDATVEGAVGRAVTAVLRDRRRRGGDGWKPRARYRRVLPLECPNPEAPESERMYAWESRNEFTGEWRRDCFSCNGDPMPYVSCDNFRKWFIPPDTQWRKFRTVIDEPSCGCCGAAWGEAHRPYRDGLCPNDRAPVAPAPTPATTTEG